MTDASRNEPQRALGTQDVMLQTTSLTDLLSSVRQSNSSLQQSVATLAAPLISTPAAQIFMVRAGDVMYYIYISSCARYSAHPTIQQLSSMTNTPVANIVSGADGVIERCNNVYTHCTSAASLDVEVGACAQLIANNPSLCQLLRVSPRYPSACPISEVSGLPSSRIHFVVGKRKSGRSTYITQFIGDGANALVIAETDHDYEHHKCRSPNATIVHIDVAKDTLPTMLLSMQSISKIALDNVIFDAKDQLLEAVMQHAASNNLQIVVCVSHPMSVPPDWRDGNVTLLSNYVVARYT